MAAMVAGQSAPLLRLEVYTYSSYFQKSTMGLTTPEEAQEAIAMWGYLALNQADRAPG